MTDIETQQEINRLNAEIERLTAQVAKEERAATQLIDERDAAEECISDIYFMMTGKSPEWSGSTVPGGGFGFAAALAELTEVRQMLGKAVRTAERERDEARAERDALSMQLDGARGCLKETEAEVARLREALTKIAGFQSEMSGWYVKVAQNALGGQP